MYKNCLGNVHLKYMIYEYTHLKYMYKNCLWKCPSEVHDYEKSI